MSFFEMQYLCINMCVFVPVKCAFLLKEITDTLFN